MDSIIAIVLLVALFFLFLNLRGRVRKLEQILRGQTEKQVVPPPASFPVNYQTAPAGQFEAAPQSAGSQPLPPAEIKKIFSEPAGPNELVEWLKEEWLLKLGALLLLIGFGWLTTYAFLNNWIGPMGRIALGIIAGALFLIIGWWRIKNYLYQGGIFLVLGSTTILLTIFAARAVYKFFSPPTALAVMFLSTAFVALASVKYNNRVLSLLSLILAGVAPLLTKTPATDHVGLFAYLFVVVLGTIWVVAATGQRALTAAALIMISLYSAPHLIAPRQFPLVDLGVLLLFAYAFAAVFFLTNIASILKLKNRDAGDLVPDLVVAAGNGLFLLAWIMTVAKAEWQSLIISAWMVVFAAGAFLIFRLTQMKEPFYAYAGVGIAMLAAATSAELKGVTLLIAYTIESGLVAVVSYLVLRDVRIAQRTALLLAGPVLLSFESISSFAWRTGVFHKDFFALFVLSAVFFGLALFFFRRAQESADSEPRLFNAALMVGGSVYAFVLLWLSLGAAFKNDDLAVMISLIIYTIIGLICHFYGLINEKRGFRIYGGALLAFVVGRLLLVDVWKMKMAGRIVTFFLIGALLVSTAFLDRKRKNPAAAEIQN